VAASHATPARLRDAAGQFEAFLLAQMLRSAREAGGGGLAGEGGGENSQLSDLAEEQFARALASQGGLGIAKIVLAGLKENANR